MGDFLCHLYDETVQFIKQHYVEGEKIWEQVQRHRHFVFSLPNGWDNVSQHRMVQAAIHARLVSSAYDGRFQIDFVSEGDASAFSCLTGHSPCTSPVRIRVFNLKSPTYGMQASRKIDLFYLTREKACYKPRHMRYMRESHCSLRNSHALTVRTRRFILLH